MKKPMKIAALAALLVALAVFAAGCGRQSASSAVSVEQQLPAQVQQHAEGLTSLQQAWEARSDESGMTFRLYYDDTRSMLGFVQWNDGSNRFVTLLDAAIDQAFGMVNAPVDGVKSVEAYTLVDAKPGDGANQELNWTQVDMSGTLRNYFMIPSFYTGEHRGHREGTLDHRFEDGTVAKVGPLSRLFMDGATPFAADGLTVIVSDLQEQGFDLNTLSNGILDYCRQVPTAKVCIVAATSGFSGQLSVPVYSISGTGSTMASVDDYEGDAAFYYVITGPTNLVDAYCDSLKEAMGDDVQNIVFATFCSSDAVRGQPLQFTLAPNTMAGITGADLADGDKTPVPDDDRDDRDDSDDDDDDDDDEGGRRGNRGTAATEEGVQLVHLSAATARTISRRGETGTNGGSTLVSQYIDRVWGSANVNGLSVNEAYPNTFAATLGRGSGSCSAFGSYVLISAYADLPAGLSAAVGDYNGGAPADDAYWIDPAQLQLYEYNGTDWVPADSNALGSISVRFEPVDGPLSEYATGQKLLAENRHVGYLRIMINAEVVSAGGLFKDDTPYYLSVPIHTSLNSTLLADVERLSGMNAAIADYRAALEGLTKRGSNYKWNASSEEARAAAVQQFCKTPKLDELVKSLSNFFQSQSGAGDQQYVDVLLAVKATSGRG